ncbi:MAG: PPOX class F420-dependent oxidoreductase [Ilumatobacteraceae bacterium]
MSISDQKYVSVTTFRKSGAAVASPVWIAPLGDGTAGFTTGADSGKVKRLRNNSKVTLRACSMRGAIVEGSPIVEATAVVSTDAERYDSVYSAIRKKYGLTVVVMGIGTRLMTLIGRQPDNCAIIITLPDA